MIIVEIVGQTYYCQDLVTQKINPFFIDRLKLFKWASDKVDAEGALQLAEPDHDEFVVESILDHRGDVRRKSSLEFKVHWLGYEQDEDSWEPYKGVRHLALLDEYVARHPALKALK